MTWPLVIVVLVAIWALYDLLKTGIAARWPEPLEPPDPPEPHCCACAQLALRLDAARDGVSITEQA